MSEAAYRDRSTALKVFGVLQIVLAAFFGLGLLGVMIGATVDLPNQPRLPAGQLIQQAVVNLGMVVAFVWTGVATIRARKWVRPVMLCATWAWLVGGVMGMVFMVTMMPRFFDDPAAKVPEGFKAVVMAVALVFAALFYIALPGAMILFYSSRNVKATLEARDPAPRWTDGKPVPVVGAFLLLTGFALGMASMMMPGMFPLFGETLRGPAAAAVSTLLVIAALMIARGVLRMDRRAWIGGVVFAIVIGASPLVTLARLGLDGYYRAAGLEEAQIEQVMKMGLDGNTMMVMMGAGALLTVGFLLWVGRFLPRQATPTP